MIKLVVLFLLLIFCFTWGFSQNKTAVINGKVLNHENPAIGFYVFLINYRDSAIVKSTTTNNKGYFNFDNLKEGKYLIALINTGYQNKYSEIITIDRDTKLVSLPDLTLKKPDKNLNEVIVSTSKPYIERKLGKTVLNLESNVFGLGSTGFEVFETLPGINIKSTELSLNGKSNIAVFIDDKPSNLTGENLIEYLKNLPTNNIEKIEIIDGNSAKYDAAYNGGIINIKFKKGKNIGTNSTISTGGGLGLNYRYNTSININKRTAKSNLYLNYDFAKIKALDQTFLNRTINSNPLGRSAFSKTIIDVSNNDIKTRNNHSAILGYDYQIDDKQSLSLLMNAFSNRMFSDELNQSLISHDELDSTINSTSLENRLLTNLSGNIRYKKDLDKKGKTFTSAMDFLTFNRNSEEDLNSVYLNHNNAEYKAPLLFNNQTPSKINIISGNIDYAIPTKKALLEFGFKANTVRISNSRMINIQSGKTYIQNPNINFNYQENIIAGYSNYAYKNDKYSISAGLRLEQTFASGDTSVNSSLIDRNYFSLFPNLSLTKQLNKKNKLALNYNKGITRPRYDQINPFSYFLDQFTYNQGNAQLRPSTINSTKLEWELDAKYVFDAHYNYTNNFIYTVYKQDFRNNVAIASMQNFDYRQSIGISLSVPITVAKWYELGLYAEGNKEYFKYLDASNISIFNSSLNASLMLNHNFQLPKAIKATINMLYETPTAYAVYSFKPLYFMNIGFSKTVFDKKGSIRLTATDIFNTNSNRYSTNLAGINLIAKDKTETQSVRLNFSYKIGKQTVKAYQKRKSIVEDEKIRVGQ
ncbi:outer membrane beta-barrel family protein [Pedobacter psychrophilus]|nr:outer membrane beta-barrel family protein [Pedobacter psychrophilus]